MNLTAWLIAMVGPLVARVIASLGFTAVVITGLGAAVLALKTLMLQHLSGLPSDALQLAGLFGIWDALGMAFGTLTFVITWGSIRGAWAFTRGTS